MSTRKVQRRKSRRGDVLLLCCSHNATRFKLLFGKVKESGWPHCLGEVYCIRKLGQWEED